MCIVYQDEDDEKKKTVLVSCAVTVDEFKAFQLQHDICVPGNVTSGSLQMGGLVSAGRHVRTH